MGLWFGSEVTAAETASDITPTVGEVPSLIQSFGEESLSPTPISLGSFYSHPSEAETITPDSYYYIKEVMRSLPRNHFMHR